MIVVFYTFGNHCHLTGLVQLCEIDVGPTHYANYCFSFNQMPHFLKTCDSKRTWGLANDSLWIEFNDFLGQFSLRNFDKTIYWSQTYLECIFRGCSYRRTITKFTDSVISCLLFVKYRLWKGFADVWLDSNNFGIRTDLFDNTCNCASKSSTSTRN